jgi:hypothetical protein
MATGECMRKPPSSAAPAPGRLCLKCGNSVTNNAGPRFKHSKDADCLTWELMCDVLETDSYEKMGVGGTTRGPPRIPIYCGKGSSKRSKADNTKKATEVIRRWRDHNMPLASVYYVISNLPELRTFLETHHGITKVSSIFSSTK